MKHTMLVAAFLATVGVAGCDWLFGPEAEPHLGVIGVSALEIEASHRDIVEGLERIWLDDVPVEGGSAWSGPDAPPALEAPDTVQAGEPFTVRVRTYWYNSCLGPAGTEIYEGRGIRVIIPWDFDEVRRDPDTPCANTTYSLTRELSFEFGNVGMASIELRGRRLIDDPDVDPSYHMVKEIVVQ